LKIFLVKALLMQTHILLFRIISSLLSPTVIANSRFNEQGKFTILQLASLHFCNRLKNETQEQINAADLQAQKLNKMLTNMAKSDHFVLSGDAISRRKGAKSS